LGFIPPHTNKHIKFNEDKKMHKNMIESFRDLDIYQRSLKLAMEVFVLTQNFPRQEQRELAVQIRKASRRVSFYIGSAWRQKRDPKEFVRTLSQAEAEVTAVEVYAEIACRCSYMEDSDLKRICAEYERILGQLALLMDTVDRTRKSPQAPMPVALSGIKEDL